MKVLLFILKLEASFFKRYKFWSHLQYSSFQVENSRDVFGDVIKVNNKEEQEAEDRETGGENRESEAPQAEADTAMEITDKKDLVEIAEENEESNTGMIQEPEQTIQASKEEEADDLQVAWEHLEVSRLAFEKLLNSHTSNQSAEPTEEETNKITKIRKYLSSVLLRLGDANCSLDNFPGALQEYAKCLEIRKETEDRYFSRQLAEMY